jgi:O-antigen/teichoic acid export membrane protein
MRQLIKSTAVLTVSNVVTRLLAMLFFVILARSLSVQEYGLFRYFLTISMIYGIAFAGIPTALTKYLSQDKKDRQYLYNAIILTTAIFLVLMILVFIFDNSPIVLILFILAFLVDSIYIGFIRGIYNIIKLSGFKFIENLIQLVILIVSYVLYKQINFTFAVIFYCFSGILTIIIFEILKPEFKIKLKLSKKHSSKLLKYGAYVMLGSIGWSLLFGINAIFLKRFYGSEYVGYFSIAETIVQIFTFLPSAITTILMPKISSLKDKTKFLKPLRAAVIGTLVVSFTILIGLILLKEQLISFIFGDKYLISATVIVPLSLGFIAITIHQIYSAVFQGMDKPKIPSITIIISAVINLLLSYYLILTYGLMGAAISNAISSIIALIMILVLFYYYRPRWFNEKQYSRNNEE